MDPTARRNWAREIQPYIKNLDVYKCPSAQLWTSPTEFQPATAPGSGNTGYLLNGIVEDRPLAAIPEPANLIFLHEIDILNRVCQMRPRPVTGGFVEFNFPRYDRQHNAGGNLLFCDGHAKWQKKTLDPARAVRRAAVSSAGAGGVRGGRLQSPRGHHSPSGGVLVTLRGSCPGVSFLARSRLAAAGEFFFVAKEKPGPTPRPCHH